MCTSLAKLAIGLSVAVATGFYYLAAAPPASAMADVCGSGNFSEDCADNSNSSRSPQSPPAPEPTPELASPEPAAVEPAAPSPEPAAVEPAAPQPEPPPVEPPQFENIYTSTNSSRSTAIPEPGTVTALLLTGAGIFCSGRKRGKQVRRQR